MIKPLEYVMILFVKTLLYISKVPIKKVDRKKRMDLNMSTKKIFDDSRNLSVASTNAFVFSLCMRINQ